MKLNKFIEQKKKEFRGNTAHVNPNCGNARFCNPHDELNTNITYNWGGIEDFLEQIIRDTVVMVEKEVMLKDNIINDSTESKAWKGYGYKQAVQELTDKFNKLKKG